MPRQPPRLSRSILLIAFATNSFPAASVFYTFYSGCSRKEKDPVAKELIFKGILGYE